METSYASEIEVLKRRADEHERTMEKLELLIEQVRDRLPNWATWAMTFGGMMIGGLFSFLVMCLK
jgi:hypothetical protein